MKSDDGDDHRAQAKGKAAILKDDDDDQARALALLEIRIPVADRDGDARKQPAPCLCVSRRTCFFSLISVVYVNLSPTVVEDSHLLLRRLSKRILARLQYK